MWFFQEGEEWALQLVLVFTRGLFLAHRGKHCQGWRVRLLWEEDLGLLRTVREGMSLPSSPSGAGRGAGRYLPLTGTVLSRGSALANLISQYTLALLLFFYILGKKLHQATWGGNDCPFVFQLGRGFCLGLNSSPMGPDLLAMCVSRPQVGPSSACRTGPPSSAWPSPACSCYAWSGGPMRSGASSAVCMRTDDGDWWEPGGPVWVQGDSCLFSPGILGMVELGAQSIVYELAIVVYMVSRGAGRGEVPGVFLAGYLKASMDEHRHLYMNHL